MKKEQIFIGNIKKCTEYEMVATTSVGIIINGRIVSSDSHGYIKKDDELYKEDVILVYEVTTSELYATMAVYPYYRAFSNAYCRECTREEYDKALDYIVKHFKS